MSRVRRAVDSAPLTVVIGMSDTEYTPTTEQVRDHFAWGLMDDPFLTRHHKAAEAFDRWLAAHEAQVRAEERERIAQAIEADYATWRGADKADPILHSPTWMVAAAYRSAARIARSES